MVTQLRCVVLGRSKSASRRSRLATCRVPASERGRSRFETHRINMEVPAALGLSANAARWWVRMKFHALGFYKGDGSSGRLLLRSVQ